MGINDIEFLIVNSKLNSARLLQKELGKRVSFEVFQDSEEDDIWNLMEGDKDDIYVYDRCGRLAYFIPYPLSVMTTAISITDGLVPTAILSTYYTNPCNGSCDDDSTSESDSYDIENKTLAEEDLISTTVSYEISYTNLTDEIMLDTTNETESVPVNETSDFEDYDISEDYTLDSRNDSKKSNRTNDINSLFHNYTIDVSPESVTINNHFNDSVNLEVVKNNTVQSMTNRTEPHTHMQTNVSYAPSRSPNTGKGLVKSKISDRCKEADFYVCKDFSKKRLMKIQNCCMLEANDEQPLACRKFGKKRCKKLQTVLKCCFKTSMPKKPMETTTCVPTSTTLSDVVCCRDTMEGKICRVSDTAECDRDGEYVATDETVTEVSM